MLERVILAHGPAQRHLLYDLLYRIHRWVVLSVRTLCSHALSRMVAHLSDTPLHSRYYLM
jgi:hypothetical protein